MRRSTARPAGWAYAGLLLMGAGTTSAAAQVPCGPERGCTNPAPQVTFTSPATATSAPYVLGTYYRGDGGIDLTTRTVKLNGAVVATGAARTSRSPDGGEAWGTDTLALRAGANTVEVTVCAPSAPGVGGACTSPAPRFTVTSNVVATTPAEARAAPEVSLSAQPLDHAFAAAAGTSLSHVTPAYVSDGAARAVALEYHSASAAAHAFVQLDVVDRSAEAPHRMSLRIRDAAGAWLTGETYFEGGTGSRRLAAQWEAGSAGTGVHAVTAVVRAYWADGVFRETTAEVRVPVISAWNGVASGLPPGWEIAGRQRIRYVARDATMWLTEGSGHVTGFRRAADGSWQALAGEPTTLADSAGGYVRRYPDGGWVVFDGLGEMVAEVDALGRRTTWEHAGAQVRAIVDPAGNRTTFVYTAAGALSQIVDPMGRTTTIVLDAPSGLWAVRGMEIVDVDGMRALTATFIDGQATRWTYRDRGEWEAAYDAAGTLSQLTAPEHAAGQRAVFRARSAMTGVLPAAGTGTWAAPARRILPQDARAVAFRASGDSTRYALDRFGNATRVESPLGFVATATHDETTGLPLRIVGENGTATTFSWTGDRLRSASTVAADGTWLAGTRVDYDAACPRYPRRIAEGADVTFLTYDARCRVRTVRAGSETAPAVLYDYDALSRVWLVTTHVTTVPVDAPSVAGRLALVSARDGSVTEHAYRADALRNPDAVRVHTRDAVRETRFAYDAYGRTTAVTDAEGRTASRAYDALNRTTSVTDPAGRATRLTYGPNYTRVQDAANRAYWYYRSAMGGVVAVSNPDGTRYAWYDGDGNLRETKNRRGQTVRATYDARGRVLTRTSAEGHVTSFAYDNPGGAWMTASGPAGTDSIRFDALGRAREVVSVLGGRRYVQRSWFRDEARRDSFSLALPGRTLTVRHRYDATGMLQRLTDMAEGTTQVGYDAMLRPSSLAYSGGMTKTVGYDAQGLAASLRYTFSGSDALPELGGRFGYDALGRLQSASTTDGSERRSFEYDPQGQLRTHLESRHWTDRVCEEGPVDERCTERTFGEVTGHMELAYDGTGNRTGGGVTMVPGTNRYATFDGFSLSYDADGNLTRKTKPGVADLTLEWNSLGQLVRATDARTGRASLYAYDAFGRRVRRTEQPTGADTYFLYEGDDLAAEVDGAGNLLRGYTTYPGVDRPHSLVTPGPGGTLQSHLYDVDALGNVRALFTRGGVVANEYRYAPFGVAAAGHPRETVANPLRYKAREQDPATGMYYMRARWYDPDLARFVSADPIGLGDGMNPYAFVGNDPVNFRDPSGLAGDTVPRGSLPGITACIRRYTANASCNSPLELTGGWGAPGEEMQWGNPRYRPGDNLPRPMPLPSKYRLQSPAQLARAQQVRECVAAGREEWNAVEGAINDYVRLGVSTVTLGRLAWVSRAAGGAPATAAGAAATQQLSAAVLVEPIAFGAVAWLSWEVGTGWGKLVGQPVACHFDPGFYPD